MAEIADKQDVANGGAAASEKSTFMTILPYLVVVGVIAAVVGVAVVVAGSGDDGNVDGNDNGVRQLNAVTFLNACEGIEAELGNQNDIVGISTCIDDQAALCLFNGEEPELQLENCVAQQRVCKCARGNGLGKIFREREAGGNRDGNLGLCTVEDSDDDECSEITDGSDFFSDTSDNSDSEDEVGLEVVQLLQQICELPTIIADGQNLDPSELFDIDQSDIPEALGIDLDGFFETLEEIFGEGFDRENPGEFEFDPNNPPDFGDFGEDFGDFGEDFGDFGEDFGDFDITFAPAFGGDFDPYDPNFDPNDPGFDITFAPAFGGDFDPNDPNFDPNDPGFDITFAPAFGGDFDPYDPEAFNEFFYDILSNLFDNFDFGVDLPEGFDPFAENYGLPEDFEFDLPDPIAPNFEPPENFEFDIDFDEVEFPPGFDINDFLPDPADFDAAFPDGVAPDFNQRDFSFCLNDEILFTCENAVGRVIDCDRRATNVCQQQIDGNIVTEADCVQVGDSSGEDDNTSDSDSDLEEITDTDTNTDTDTDTDVGAEDEEEVNNENDEENDEVNNDENAP